MKMEVQVISDWSKCTVKCSSRQFCKCSELTLIMNLLLISLSEYFAHTQSWGIATTHYEGRSDQ
jgi:hypothetical protein